jgi:hypothetical protein
MYFYSYKYKFLLRILSALKLQHPSPGSSLRVPHDQLHHAGREPEDLAQQIQPDHTGQGACLPLANTNYIYIKNIVLVYPDSSGGFFVDPS